MAVHPSFGEGSGFALDVGQPESVRRAANDATYPANVEPGQPRQVEPVVQFPEQDFVARGNMGFSGQTVTWTGHLKCKDQTVYEEIVSELSEFKSGREIVDGALGTFDEDKMTPRQLVDSFEVKMGKRAKLVDYRFGRARRPQNPAWWIMVPLTIVFEILE